MNPCCPTRCYQSSYYHSSEHMHRCAPGITSIQTVFMPAQVATFLHTEMPTGDFQRLKQHANSESPPLPWVGRSIWNWSCLIPGDQKETIKGLKTESWGGYCSYFLSLTLFCYKRLKTVLDQNFNSYFIEVFIHHDFLIGVIHNHLLCISFHSSLGSSKKKKKTNIILGQIVYSHVKCFLIWNRTYCF